jgi:hypothetical protein
MYKSAVCFLLGSSGQSSHCQSKQCREQSFLPEDEGRLLPVSCRSCQCQESRLVLISSDAHENLFCETNDTLDQQFVCAAGAYFQILAELIWAVV